MSTPNQLSEAGGAITVKALAPEARAIASAAHAAPSDSSIAQAKRATPDLWRFCSLSGQLALLLIVSRLYHLQDVRFQSMAMIVCGAFLVHYWLPFRFKEPFLAAVSLGAAFVLLPPQIAALLIVTGITFFLLLRLPIAFRWRLLPLAGIFGVLIYGCATGHLPIPASFYAVFGAIFMFRIIAYCYDLAHSREPARLIPFLNYFFILPNYCFMLFPVIDFQTMRQTYYRRDIHDIAEQGIQWMVRGMIQLALYRLVFYLNDQYLPDRVSSLGALVSTMILTYLLYMNVSGQFHMAIGMLHLFGYDLPETNRKYLLARSFTDLWRRNNIYWKNFMVKVVYFPLYFRLRKKGDLLAQVVSTAAVFVATWFLHMYQSFWIIGQRTMRANDTLFWAILGTLMMLNVLYDRQHKPVQSSGWRGFGLQAAQVLGTFSLMTILWSMWSAPSLRAWIYLMTHWIGADK